MIKEHFGCDQEPEFDKDFSVTNMNFYKTKLPNGKTITNVIHLDEEERIWVGRYTDGEQTSANIFPSYEAYQDWLSYELKLHERFKEWMDEYVKKKKATIIHM